MAAFVPLITTVAPELIQLIAGLVKSHIGQTSASPQSGGIDLTGVFNSVMVALENAASQGTIPKTLPPDDVVKMIVQTAATALHAPAPVTAPVSNAAASGSLSITLASGQSLTISAK